MKNLPNNPASIPNLLRKLVAVVATVAMISLALMFSMVVIALILLVGTLAWAYLMWKTRYLRKQMRNHPLHDVMREGAAAKESVFKGEVIEGEVIRVSDTGKAK